MTVSATNASHDVPAHDEQAALSPVPIPPQHEFNLVCAADIKPQPIDWLWPDRFGVGFLSIIAAPGGVGKSTLATSIASIITNSGTFPFTDDKAQQGTVVWISGEESLEYQLTPRAIAADVDMSRLHFVRSVKREDGDGAMRLSMDAGQLVGLKHDFPDLRLVIVDPLSAFLDARDSYKESDVRQVLTPWVEAAEQAEVAVIFIAHFNKGKGGHVRDKLSGSTAIRNAVRAVYVVMDDPDDDNHKLFLPEKNNLSDDKISGLRFRITSKEWSTDDDSGTTPCVEWVGETDLKANEVANVNNTGGKPIEGAKEFLASELAAGPIPVKEIKAATDTTDLAWRTVERAKMDMGIEHHKTSGKWTWYTADQWEQANSDPS